MAIKEQKMTIFPAPALPGMGMRLTLSVSEAYLHRRADGVQGSGGV